MSLNLSSLLRLSAASLVFLSVGACKPADKGQGALKSEGISALNLSKSESGIFGKYFASQDCDVDEMEALGALAGLGLGEKGNNGFDYSRRDVSNGQVIFTDISTREDGSPQPLFSAKSAVFHCPKMGEEAPYFDRVDFRDVFIFDPDEKVEFTADTVNIAKPTPDSARAIVTSITQAKAGNFNDSGFGAISITNAKIKSDEINGTLTALSWGEIRDDDGHGTADLTLDDLDLSIPGKSGAQDMNVSFEGMSVRNMNIGGKIDRAPMSTNSIIGSVMGNLNVFNKPYDELIVETLKIDSAGFNVDFGGIEGKTTESGDVITTRQSLKPTEITLKPALGENPKFARNYEILKSLDFETIKMSGSSVTTLNEAADTVSVSDGLFVIDGAMRLNFEYNAEGVGAVTEKLNALQASGNSPDMIAALDALKLQNLRLTLEDNSIVARGLKLATEMTGQSEKNIKRSLGMAVFAAAMAAENDVQAEVYSETTEAFADFVKNGGTLTIEANPPEPFPLAPLLTNKGADIDPASLGFSASQDGGAK